MSHSATMVRVYVRTTIPPTFNSIEGGPLIVCAPYQRPPLTRGSSVAKRVLPSFMLTTVRLHALPYMMMSSKADVFELVLTGYASAIVPTLLVPMDAQIFLGVTAFSHWWTIYLHNNAAHLLPPWLGLDFVYTSHDHNIHHYYGQKNYNFGLYFRFWDRLLGTYKETVPTCARLSRSNEKVQPRKKPQFQN